MLKKLVCMVLLAVLLIGLGLINGTQLFGEIPNPQIGESQVSVAAMTSWEVKVRKAQYDDDGLLIGCFNTGKDCVIVVMDVAGREVHVLITADEMILR